MNLDWTKLAFGILLTSSGLSIAAPSAEEIAQLPPPAEHRVDFPKEIKPIFEASCIKCHARGKAKGGFRLDNRELFVKGGEDGPSIVLGKSAESHLIELVAGLNPDKPMPQKGSRLTTNQVGLLRAWIDQGAIWDEAVSFAKPLPLNLDPRHPTIPTPTSSVASQNPIDLFLQPYYEAHSVTPPQPVEDRIFARRVYLDVIGLLPPSDELRSFVADVRSDKRQRLVKRLLADNQRYAENWLTFWNDLLRNDYKGTGFIDGGREQISYWLFKALAENLPFNQFVAQLISPDEDSLGFTKGIVWRGVVNASQVPQMQAAQNISQVFMGVNLKCASCHDSFINDWTLAEAYGLASIYADEPLELFKCDKPTGQKAVMKFVYPQLGDIDSTAPKAERLKQLAQIVADKHDGRFTRVIVNRFWAKLMGRGLVEPVDDMENPAWNQDLLDWLASDLADNGFDLKRTLEWILTSQAYQLPAVDLGEERGKDFVFRGPGIRRMTAEQFRDALGTISGVWYTLPAAPIGLSSPLAGAPSPDRAPIQPKWLWKEDTAAEDAADLTLYLRKVVDLPNLPTEAQVVATCDNGFTLYINGKEVTSSKDFKKPKLVDVRDKLVKGENLFAVSAVNEPVKEEKKEKDQDKEKPGDKQPEKRPEVKAEAEKKTNPAGFILYARIRDTQSETGVAVEKVWDLASDSTWLWTTAKFENWEKPDFSPEGWAVAAELGSADIEPWRFEGKLSAALSAAAQYGRTRAALVAADPLMLALGRPNREQVMTTRSAAATTLQALELTNGGTLANLLKRGAEKLVGTNIISGSDLVDRLYRQALGRDPTPAEMNLAQEAAGSPARQEGVEDVVWALAMLPEFQLIY